MSLKRIHMCITNHQTRLFLTMKKKTVLKMCYVFTVTECFDFAVSGNSCLTDFRVYIKIYYDIRHTENNPVMPHNRNWNQPIPIFSTASSTV